MKFNKFLACLLFMGLNLAFADDTISFDTIFSTAGAGAAGDVSISFLTALFGNVSTVLVGGSNQIVPQMFMVFNTGIIAFVSALVFYTMAMSVINTAQDGNAMGQKVSTWIVVRIVAGFSVLIPQYSGYSLIQVMVMWSVVQGVGFADNVWSTALDTIQSYGGAVVTPSESQDQVYKDIAKMATGGKDKNSAPVGSANAVNDPVTASSVFAAAICAKAMYNKAVSDYNTGCPASGCTGTAPSIANYGYFQKSAYSGSNKPETWCFGYSSDGTGKKCDATCGEFQVDAGVGSFYAQALGDMVLVTSPAAVSTYDSYVSSCETDASKCSLGSSNGDATITDGCGSTKYSQNSVCVAANILNSGGSTFYSTSLADRLKSNPVTENTAWIESAKNAGWAMAGAHYMDLSGGGDTTAVYSYNSLQSPKITVTVPNNVKDWKSGYSSDAWYKAYTNMIENSSSASAALSQYMMSSNAWTTEMEDQALDLNTGDGTSDSGMDCTGSGWNKKAKCRGTGSVSTVAITYDKFTAYMLQSLISEYKPEGGDGASNNDPFDNLGSGDSLMFPETEQGKFHTFPIYLWSLLTQNLAALAGIDLYADDHPDNLYLADMDHIASINQRCLRVASVCSVKNEASVNYQGCLDAAIQYRCINPENHGLLGSVRAVYKSQLVDPLYSMSLVGQTFIKYSTAYWGSAIKAVYSKTTRLASSYTGVSMATAIGMSAAAQLAVMFSMGFDITGGIAILTGATLSVYQLLFQIDKIVMEAYLPLGSAVALVFFILGVTLGVYLPFIPFLLFLFGLINWLISVVEAMVAAPLVALGVTHPEGHDLLGKAEQSMMLLLGVFIRPAAMVIGFILAITLTYLIMQFLNYGFVYTANPLLKEASANSTASFNMISIVGVLLVYTYVAIEVINQCFSMIFQVPDKVLRWIGGPQEQSNVSQMMQSVKGGVQSGAQGAGSAASGQASKGVQVSPASSSFQQPKKGEGESEGDKTSAEGKGGSKGGGGE